MFIEFLADSVDFKIGRIFVFSLFRNKTEKADVAKVLLIYFVNTWNS